MKIVNNAFASNFISIIKLPEFPTLNDRQKIIVEIALCALGIIALFFAIKRCCCMKVKVESKKPDEGMLERSAIFENVLNDEILDDRILVVQPTNVTVDESELADELELTDDIEPTLKKPIQTSPVKEKPIAKINQPEEKKDPQLETEQKESDDHTFKTDPHPKAHGLIKKADERFNIADERLGINDTSEDTRPRVLKDRFGTLSKEISSGRLFSSLTNDEREGLSLIEITALAIADHANRMIPPPDNSDPPAVEESEWN